MGRITAVCLLVLAGCGRVGFDDLQAASEMGDAGGQRDALAQPDADGDSIPPGARIWLRMNTDPAGGIIDSAGGHTVTCTTSCPTLVPGGLHGNAYAFDSQELQVTYAADLDASAGFTAAMWINVTQDPTSSNACPYGKSYNSAQGWDMFVLGIQPDGTSFFDGESNMGVTSSEYGPAMPTGTWHHLAMTWDGSTRVDYQDGAMVASTPIVTGSSSTDVTVGGAPGYWYTGEMADVVFYTRVLSPEEITQLATP